MLRGARPAIIPFIWVGITIGMLASFRDWHFPQPNPGQGSYDRERLELHQDFLHQREAWEALRRHTDPGDLVQNNPINYAKVVTRWPAPAPVALFGDRPVAYGDWETVKVFAHPYDSAQKDNQHAAITALFNAHPEPATLAYARDVLKIKALLVDPRDQVWKSKAIDNSGIYRLVEATDRFKIYVAVADSNTQLTTHDWIQARSYIERGRHLILQGKLDEAKRDLDQAIRMAPERASAAYLFRGAIHHRQGDRDAAMEDYSKAIQLMPDDDEAYDYRGDLRYQMKDYPGAVSDYRTLTKLKPDDPDAYSKLGIALIGLGNYKEAEQTFKVALEHALPDWEKRQTVENQLIMLRLLKSKGRSD